MAALLVVAWAVSLIASAPSSSAAANHSVVMAAVYTADAADSSFVRTVSYSTGRSTRKLEWLPVRPSKEEAARRPAKRMAQYAPPSRTEQVQPHGVDPFDDPFGDLDRDCQLVPPASSLNDDLLEESNPQPLPVGPLPQLLEQQPLLEVESSEQSEQIEVPSLKEALAAGPEAELEKCPTPEDLKPISDITHDISAKEGKFPRECGLGDQRFQPRAWTPTTFTWKASGVCHKPLYFEQVHLERYGHSCGPYIQPIVSGAHFFLTVPILPYKMGLYPPTECIYTLGYYRPGSCAPYLLDPLPLSIRAALAEGGVWTGMVFAIP